MDVQSVPNTITANNITTVFFTCPTTVN